MHELDLGDEIKINVKYAGKDYILREPMVSEIEDFQKHGDKPGMHAVIDLLAQLGMPKEVVQKMGMSKATKLVDGLMEVLTKKK